MNYAPTPTEDQLRRLAGEISPGSGARPLRRFEGGLGCTTDLIEFTERSGSVRKLVLRRYGDWYADDRNHDVTRRETAALQIAAAGDVAVPELVWVDEHGIFAEQAIVISYIDGKPDLQPDDVGSWTEQIATMLARIHDCSLSVRGPNGPNSKETLVDLHALNVRRSTETEASEKFTAHPLGEQLWQRMQDLIAADLAHPPREPMFLHADFWPGNLLWKNGELAAVIDWEDAGFGDPAADILYCANDMRYAGLPEAADQLIARYRALTGRSLETAPLWTIMALTRPMPDIGRWFPSWPAMGVTNITIEELRDRYYRLVENALADTN